MAIDQEPPMRRTSHSIASCSSREKFCEHATNRPIKHYIPPGALASYSQEGTSALSRLSDRRPKRRLALKTQKPVVSQRQVPQEQPMFPCKTIATLFSQRRHRIALQAQCLSFKQHVAEHNARSDLLKLPDELLVKVVCNLRHDETSPLSKVCQQMQGVVKEAVKQHFDYATPAVHPLADTPWAPRNHKRQKIREMESTSFPRLQHAQPARALKFPTLNKNCLSSKLRKTRSSFSI